MRKPIAVTAALVAAFVGYSAWHRHSATSDRALVRDRVWIDHMPRDQRETVNVFVMVSEQSAGVFNAQSAWRGAYELFRFEQSGEEIRMVFPQTGDRDRVRATARRCDERGFDFCLELSGASRGVKRYFSREGWELRTLDDTRARLDAIEQHAEP